MLEEKMILELMKQLVEQCPLSDDIDSAINDLLAFIGNAFGCERCHIFQKNIDGTFYNSYEWCADRTSTRKALLQKEQIDTFAWCFMDERSAVLIKDIELIKESYPIAYATIKSLGIHSFIGVPVSYNEEIIAVLGIDNPRKDKEELCETFLQLNSNYISVILRSSILQDKLFSTSYRDQLTGTYSRHAFFEDAKNIDGRKSVGLIYCDITELKKVNDNYGHSQGNKLIMHWCSVIKATIEDAKLYRLGGDEFVALIKDVSESKFLTMIDKLKTKIQMDTYHLAIGYDFSEASDKNIEDMMKKADAMMYEDKRQYYAIFDRRGRSHNEYAHEKTNDSEFAKFMANNHFDCEFFWNSLGARNTVHYLYYGDMQSNFFFISDNMKEMFGFENNIVYNLLLEWGKRICDEEDLKMYNQDIADIMENHREYHDLRYRVKDCKGNILWIHCQGKIKWNEDKSKPLFFAGSVSHQEYDFIVDRLTNFPKEAAALEMLTQLRHQEKNVYIIGFSLNSLRKINEALGREIADSLIRDIAFALQKEYGKEVYFYRMDGMRFIAIGTFANAEDVEELIIKLEHTVSLWYKIYDINIVDPCSIGYLRLEQEESGQKIIEKAMNVIGYIKDFPERNFAIYADEAVEKAKMNSRLALALNRDVNKSMEHFSLDIQPIVNIGTEEIIGGEALLRWEHDGKKIPCNVFVPLLETSKAIINAGEWVIEEALRSVARIRSYRPNFYISINITYIQIYDSNIFAYIQQTLDKYRLDGSALIIELTENHIDEHPERLRTFINDCQRIDIKFALDDFGNAYSSLAMLLKYPSDIVKLDRSLVKEVVSSADNEKLLNSIVYCCHQLNKIVCVEGIESKEEMQIMQKIGVDSIQGFYYYKPININKIYDVIVNNKMFPYK